MALVALLQTALIRKFNVLLALQLTVLMETSVTLVMMVTRILKMTYWEKTVFVQVLRL
jgi:hypothetical protein